MKTALIIIDHGSRRAESNAMLEQIAERLRSRGGYCSVAAAHMELAEPTLAQVFAEQARAGAAKIVIVPYFFAPGRHMTEDIPALAHEAAKPFPEVEWTLAEPLGVDERIIDVLIDRAKQAETKQA